MMAVGRLDMGAGLAFAGFVVAVFLAVYIARRGIIRPWSVSDRIKDGLLYLPRQWWEGFRVVAARVQKRTAEMPSRRVYLAHKRTAQFAGLLLIIDLAGGMVGGAFSPLDMVVRAFGIVAMGWFAYNLDVGWHHPAPELICTGCGREAMEPNGDGRICAVCGRCE